MKNITVYTDGGCSPNPGDGGWAAILIYGKHVKEISGYGPRTTNNRMELTAVISALEALKEPCRITLNTDSQYISNAFNKNWLISWKRNGWKKAKGRELPNAELWAKLDALAAVHEIKWIWVRGHAGNRYNSRCDELAGIAIGTRKKYTL